MAYFPEPMEIFASDTGAHFLLEMFYSLGFSKTTVLEFLFFFLVVPSLIVASPPPLGWLLSSFPVGHFPDPGLLGVATHLGTWHTHVADTGG